MLGFTQMLGFLQHLLRFRQEQRDHPHAIFQLRQVAVAFQFRKRYPPLDVELVGKEQERLAQPLCQQLRPFPPLSNERSGVSFGQRGERWQLPAMTGEADRNNCKRSDEWMHPGKILHGARKRLTVVEPRAEHDLGVHGDPRPCKFLHDIEDRQNPALAEQLLPQDGIRRMNRDIKRRQSLCLDPLQLGAADVGESHVVSVEKGEAVILVLHVERASQSLGKLVYETKDAVVTAASGRGRLEAESQRLPLFTLHLKLPELAVCLLQFENQDVIRAEVVIINNVAQSMPVHRDEAIPRLDLQLFRDASRHNSVNDEP